MAELIDDTTVQVSTEVAVAADRAFELFTTEIASWWDEDKHILRAPLVGMVFEPFVGGQIIDLGADGSECRWARVLVYDPPRRVCFSWDINLQWELEIDPARCSEVEITFEPIAETRTQVTLTHRHLDRHGPGWEQMRDAAAGGWNLISFEALAQDAHQPMSAGHAQIHEKLDATPDEVFAALSTLDGLRAWWTADAQGDPAVGGEVTFTFRPGNTTTMRIDRLDAPRRVEWTCVAQHVSNFDPPDEWVGTRVIFDLVERTAGTGLTFTHEGLDWLGCREQCVPGWEHYIGTSLRRHLSSRSLPGLTLQPMIHVEDLAASIAFYEHLGGELKHGNSDGDWAVIRMESAEIGLLAHPPNSLQNQGTVELNFTAEDDLDHIETALAGAGVRIAQPVTETGFGRQLQLLSPDGLLIKINEFGPQR